MEVVINRINKGDKQITGELSIFDNDDIIFSCATLELPDLDNEPNKSCIPVGVYSVVKRVSPKFGAHFHVLNVPNRKYILIHRGNFYTDIRGCILVGSDLIDINHDGLKDVVNSSDTMRKMTKILPNEFKLKIL